MKNLFKSVVTVIAIIFSLSNQAQTKSPKLENSLLWEVSGNGLEKPSYLYGTIHVICGEDYFLSEKTKKAFEASGKLVLEMNYADPNEMEFMQKSAMGKEPLSKKLNPEQLAKLDAILKKSTGMTIKQVDAFTLMTVSGLISMKNFGCTDMKFYEMEFAAMAKKRNIEVVGLETVKFQIESYGNAYSDDETIAMSEEADDDTDLSVANYKKENIEELYKASTAADIMTAKAKKYMLDERNSKWVEVLPELMKKESLFVGVGAAHLGGEFGVINLLRKAGYIVKPIMN
ncbi:hypothetical protein SAMN05444397_105337 [Flavobacterium aquidurense]|uniref:TraB/GumN family protein n=1 Tax=Flavobacterium frigidimaris TaxID=262320 RepID=A0ABX4BW55_FLAFR|nr:TraB/GumN family protein [Flavobacterium frigidimaris]OXA81822.1 TraB/GumN family protein [Flavobacterium frigidimaris]SDZ35311.1 hypothetical protein SAMN05444397_105337 [Flavobacterium aquidurense]